MNKPVSIIIEDFQTNLMKTLNESQLPLSILDIILCATSKEVHELSLKQTEKERMEYELMVSQTKQFSKQSEVKDEVKDEVKEDA